MKRMRLLVAILIVWLFLFYNIERLSRPINITTVAYVFVPAAALFTILIPRLRKAPLWVLLAVPVPLFLALKLWIGFPVWGTELPLTVTEICVIEVTIILTRWVSNGVAELEDVIARITIGFVERLPEPFSKGQAEMYQEMSRARHYQRPLALMAVGVDEKSIHVVLDRLVQEVQQAMMKQYVLSDVARMLCDELEEYNVIARSNDHFLALLPEMTPEELADLSSRLRQAVTEEVGVELRIGTASFPQDALTFESLIEKATRNMGGERGVEVSVRPQRLVTEQRAM